MVGLILYVSMCDFVHCICKFYMKALVLFLFGPLKSCRIFLINYLLYIHLLFASLETLLLNFSFLCFSVVYIDIANYIINFLWHNLFKNIFQESSNFLRKFCVCLQFTVKVFWRQARKDYDTMCVYIYISLRWRQLHLFDLFVCRTNLTAGMLPVAAMTLRNGVR